MIKFILSFLRLFRPFFQVLGVNPGQLEIIVGTKLTIDNRIERNGKYTHKSNNTLLKQVLLMSVIGCFFFFMTYQTNTLPVTLFIYHSYLSIVIFTSFMTEYARLLFDSKDNHIIERFPVNDRTVLFARIISMLSYLYLIALGMAFFPFLILIYKESWSIALLFFISILSNTLFTLLLSNFLYIGLMRLLPAEKFQKIITYLQSILVVGIVIGYQFVSKLAHARIDLIHHPSLWVFFTPPSYFTAFTELGDSGSKYPWILAGTGLFLTLFLILVIVFFFSPSYIKNASFADKSATVKIRNTKEHLPLFLARTCGCNPLQQSGFMLTWRMTRGNLKFKQSILPMLLYALIFNIQPLYQIFNHTESISLQQLLFPLYMLPFICIGIIMNLGYTEQNNLLWLYQSRPLERPGAILLGAFKAVYIKYFLPFLLFIYLIYFWLCGFSILPDLLLAWSLSTLFLIVFYRNFGTVFPFSKEKNTRESGGALLKIFGTLFLLILTGIGHYLLTFLPAGIWYVLPFCWLLIYYQTKKIQSLTLQQIESHY